MTKTRRFYKDFGSVDQRSTKTGSERQNINFSFFLLFPYHSIVVLLLSFCLSKFCCTFRLLSRFYFYSFYFYSGFYFQLALLSWSILYSVPIYIFTLFSLGNSVFSRLLLILCSLFSRFAYDFLILDVSYFDPINPLFCFTFSSVSSKPVLRTRIPTQGYLFLTVPEGSVQSVVSTCPEGVDGWVSFPRGRSSFVGDSPLGVPSVSCCK